MVPLLTAMSHFCQGEFELSLECGISADIPANTIRRERELFRAESVVVGDFVSSDVIPEPWFFLGEIRRNQAIGGGFWKVAVELTEFASPAFTDELAELKPLAAKLATPAASAVV